MSIRVKVLLVILLSLATLALTLAGVAQWAVGRHVRTLEAQEHQELVRRILASFETEEESLTSKIGDWAEWDDAWRFMRSRDPAFLQANLIPSAFTGMKLGVIAFFDERGLPVSVHGADPAGAPMPVPREFGGDGALLPFAAPGPDRPVRGMLCLADGRLALFAAATIRPGSVPGEPRGTLVFARWIDADVVGRLQRMTDLPLYLLPPAAAPLALRASRDIAAPPEGERMVGWLRCDDVRGHPAAALRWEAPRIAAQQARGLLGLLQWSLAGVVVVAGLLAVACLHLVVVRRVLRLGHELGAVAGDGDLARRVTVDSRDEIGSLAATVNRTLAALGEAQSRVRAGLVEVERARHRAEAVNQAKSSFLATMSHELRTPLNGVLGMAELLQAGERDPERRSRLEVIRASGEDLLNLINDVLDLSKIEAERLELERVRLHPWEIIEHVLDLLAPRAHAKGVELAFIPGEGLPHAMLGDGPRFKQVLTNLVGNAVKFTERGEVTVWADAEIAGGEGLLRVAVSDTGPGMSSAVRERLFQPFTQGDDSVARRYGGTGLGLAISRRLVELMGGQISVDSEPGRGSTFAFTVRMALDPGSTDREPMLPSGCRVMVRAASPGLGLAASSLLEWYGAETVEGLDGRPTVAVVDVDLGQEAGLTAQAAAAADPPVPVLLMVGLRGIPAGAVLPGGGRRLGKPLRRHVLLAAVRALHEGRSDDRRPGTGTAVFQRLWSDARVLVVDDHEVNRLVVSGLLRNAGCEPTVAAGGAEAMGLLASATFDLVLLDCQMPEVDGFAVVADLRRREAGTASHTPVVALTANAMTGDRERCLSGGFDDHLPKPVSGDDLRRCLDRWLAPRSATAGPSTPAAPAPAAPAPAEHDDLPAALQRLRSELGSAVASEVQAAFRRDAPRLMAEMAEALTSGNLGVAARRAHALKGDAGNLGLPVLSARAAAVERAAQSGDAQATRGEFGALTVHWSTVAPLLG